MIKHTIQRIVHVFPFEKNISSNQSAQKKEYLGEAIVDRLCSLLKGIHSKVSFVMLLITLF